jgi:hypothetical protein
VPDAESSHRTRPAPESVSAYSVQFAQINPTGWVFNDEMKTIDRKMGK